MNSETLKAITGVLALINPALGIIGAFASSFGDSGGKVTKVTNAVKDAASVAGSLMPFIESFGREEDFTLADVRKAIESSDAQVAAFDAAIAASP